jgi:hypothetical protein
MISYPGSWISDSGSRIPDPTKTTTTTKRGGGNVSGFCSHKFHKIVHYFIFTLVQKKIVSQLRQRIEVFITQKIVLSSQKYGFGIRDPGCGKYLSGILDPDLGVKKHPPAFTILNKLLPPAGDGSTDADLPVHAAAAEEAVQAG